jgi:predicted RNase H-like nuclease
MWIVGVDCATKDTKVGLAFGRYDNGILKIEDAALCSPKAPSTARISDWLHQENRPALLAIDAPLGWPVDLAPALTNHRAGTPIPNRPDDLFHRKTDSYITKNLGKRPLEIGADRIARTAHAALDMLGALRLSLMAEIPLAWVATDIKEISAIEVYPAATLTAHGLLSSGYKKKPQTEERRQILEGVKGKIDIPQRLISLFEANADALDASLCLLAAKDFLDGHVIPPPSEIKSVAEIEGWIWAAPMQF